MRLECAAVEGDSFFSVQEGAFTRRENRPRQVIVVGVSKYQYVTCTCLGQKQSGRRRSEKRGAF